MAGHHHHHRDFSRAFLAGIILNTLFAIAEAAIGLIHGSMALVADAGHNLSDVAGLAIAWLGAGLARRAPTRRFTWGYRGSTTLAALANALLLLVAVGAILLEAIGRLAAADPPTPPAITMIWVAAIGIAINGAVALSFAAGRKRDLNIRGAFLHMAADAAVSAGIVLGGLLILATGESRIDPLLSLAIAIMIFWNSWGLLRQSLALSLGAVPEGIDPDAVEAALASLPGVVAVHHLHVWPMGTADAAMSAHLVMAAHPGNAFLRDAEAAMHDRFHIGHATLQIELDEAGDCRDCL
ncbi:MAG: cation diffusion facilitator family transporter [Sphingosinicella sp.]